jgi:hypothetical protein
MWVFADWGLVMPALVQPGEFKKDYTENGKYNLQVRGRLTAHLEYFMETYMEPGTYNPEIHATPDHDYNFRFYTTHEAFAAAMTRAIMDIDYRKFKPSSERKNPDGTRKYKFAEKYHRILNGIWGVVCGLNTPGDVWGPWSPENPKGYRSASRYFPRGEDDDRPVGSSFFGDEDLDDDDEFDGWFSTKEERIDKILSALQGIPASEWDDYLNDDDYALMKDVIKAEIEAEETRRSEKRAQKLKRKAERHYRRNKNPRHATHK